MIAGFVEEVDFRRKASTASRRFVLRVSEMQGLSRRRARPIACG